VIQDRDKNNLLDVTRIVFLNVNDKGIINTWIRPHKKTTQSPSDASVLANVLRFLTKLNLHEEALPTMNFIQEELSSGSFENGYHYYKSSAVFLYYVSCLLLEDVNYYFYLFKESLVSNLRSMANSVNEESPAVDISLLLLSIKNLVLCGFQIDDLINACGKFSSELLTRQNADGGWLEDGTWIWPSKNMWMAGRNLPSIYATAALEFCINLENLI